MTEQNLAGLATDARINERLIARGMAPMQGPVLSQILHEAIGETLSSRDALRLWDRDRLARDQRVQAVLRRFAAA